VSEGAGEQHIGWWDLIPFPPVLFDVW
jgi:hypothetical protein